MEAASRNSLERAYGGTRVEINGSQFELYLSAEEIAAGVARTANELSIRFANANPLMICVLNGAAIFHADLIRQMPIPLEVDYMRVSSYGKTMESSGNPLLHIECGTVMEGRNVVIVEDIVDTGRTGEFLRGYLKSKGAASVEIATLLFKEEAFIGKVPPENVTFSIPNRFVVGYGLDYAEQGRNLPAIYSLCK